MCQQKKSLLLGKKNTEGKIQRLLAPFLILMIHDSYTSTSGVYCVLLKCMCYCNESIITFLLIIPRLNRVRKTSNMVIAGSLCCMTTSVLVSLDMENDPFFWLPY